MIEFTDSVTVPDKCKNCPVVAQCAQEFTTFNEHIDELTEAGLSGELHEALVEMIMEVDNMTQEEAEARLVANKDVVTEETSRALDELDQLRDMKVTLANVALKLCDGQLKLQGSGNGQRVTAYVCMSDIKAFSPDIPNGELVVIEREPEQ